MKKKLNGEAGGGLAQEDWDFSGCPPGREYDCWSYEYAREVPFLGEKCRSVSEAEDYVDEPAYVDEHGNWHGVWRFPGSGEDHVVETPLVLLRGFPGTPYLKTDYHLAKADPELGQQPSVANVRDVFGRWSFGPRVELVLNWGASDSQMTEDFAKWLRENRPRPAWNNRGVSEARKWLADLRALGAWRLLKHMTAREAMEYVRGYRRTVYSKLPDWYEAKRRVRRVLRDHFGWGWPS